MEEDSAAFWVTSSSVLFTLRLSKSEEPLSRCDVGMGGVASLPVRIGRGGDEDVDDEGKYIPLEFTEATYVGGGGTGTRTPTPPTSFQTARTAPSPAELAIRAAIVTGALWMDDPWK